MTIKDISWAASFERAARNTRLPARKEIQALAEVAQEMAAPAQEVVEAAGELEALAEILAPGSDVDPEDREEARENLREQAAKMAAALRELDGLMTRS